MDKNKSIDGLMPRSQKIAAKKSTKSTKPKSVKSATSSKAPKAPTPKTSRPKSTKSSARRTPAKAHPATPKIVPEPTITETTITEASTTKSNDEAIADFLKPVQAFNFDEESGKLEAAEQPLTTETPEPESSDPNTIDDTPTDLPDTTNENTEEPLKPQKTKKPKKPVSKKKKVILTIVLILLLLIIGAGTAFIIWGNDIIAKITGGQGNVFDLVFTEETYERLKTDANGRTNILAFGTSGYDMEGTEGDGTHDGAQLTDSIMIISLNQDTGDIAFLSLPRDLYTTAACSAGKINEVYWCNNMNNDNEKAGAEVLMSAVGNILGLDFQYYAHVNWESLIQIVDTLGGITVTLDEDIADYYYTKAVYDAGVEYNLGGAEALGLARARHGTTGGDFSRGNSQQKILIAIINKIKAKSLSLTDLIGLANVLGDNLRTNFSLDEIRSVAHLTSSFDFNSMRQVSLTNPTLYLTTGNIGAVSVVIPVGGTYYYDNIQNYVAKMFSSDPKVYEEPTIIVLNGTDTPGLAATEQANLIKDGYTTVEVGDAPAGDYPENYYIYEITGGKPGTKKLLEDTYHTTAHPAEELPAGVDTNYDFIIILGGKTDTEKE